MRHLILKCMLCVLSAIQWSLPSLEMALYSGFSMRRRRKVHLLLLPGTTPKITLIILPPTCSLGKEGDSGGGGWGGEGRNWGVRSGERQLLLESQQYPGEHCVGKVEHRIPFSLALANSGDGICIPSPKSSLLWSYTCFSSPFLNHVLSTLMIYTNTATNG